MTKPNNTTESDSEKENPCSCRCSCNCNDLADALRRLADALQSSQD